MKTRIVLSVFLVAAVFCGIPLKAEKPTEEKMYDRIFLPDSLFKGQPLAMKYKVAALMLTNVSVKDGLLVSSMTEKDFTDNGIPINYYGILQKNIADGNRMVKESQISKEDMEKSFGKAKKDFLGKLETENKDSLISALEKETGVSVEDIMAGKIVGLGMIGDSATRSAIRVRGDSVLRSLKDKKLDNDTVRTMVEMLSGKKSGTDVAKDYDSTVRSTIRVRGNSLFDAGKSLYNKWLSE